MLKSKLDYKPAESASFICSAEILLCSSDAFSDIKLSLEPSARMVLGTFCLVL